jgi:hypothetical protein
MMMSPMNRCWAWRVLVAATSGCGFQAQASVVDAAVDAAIDAPLGSCAPLRCDPNATCVATAGAATCVCRSGYAGDGASCSDVNECATNNGGCSAACQNTVGGFTCYVPRSCVDIAAHVPGGADGPYTLYLGGDLAKPWTAYCANLATTPREYLTLTGGNTARYVAGGASLGTDVTTTYAKVRIDPATLKLDVNDRLFAASQGAIDHAHSGVIATSVALGAAIDCVGSGAANATASIDLTGTPFALTGAAAFALVGTAALGTVAVTANNQRAAITGGGFCGWNAPVGAKVVPFNDNTAGLGLPVVYAP